MTQEEIFIRRFEAGEVKSDEFHHVDHVRLAFSYLCNYPVLDALAQFSKTLRQFAAAQGKAERYNETITFAYFFLINERMARRQFVDWDDFADTNPDILSRNNELLNRYYEQLTLKSDVARNVFVFPDKC